MSARRRTGFSSTEVIVCIAIFAAALVPIIQLISGGTRPTAYNEYHLAAQSVATHVVDRVLEIIVVNGFGGVETMGTGERVKLEDHPTYGAKWDAADKAPVNPFFEKPEVWLTNLSDAGGGLVQVTVIVKWQLPDGHKYQFALDRLVCRPEIGLTSDFLPRQVPVGKK